MTLKAGAHAPDFSLQDTHGHVITLHKLKGSTIVLYFYPKDDTSGCTLEAQEFTRHKDAFAQKGVLVFGISPDSVESHCAFEEKYNLGVTLLADPQHTTCEAYGCWVEKERNGEKFMGVPRTTFIIDKEGTITHVFENVEPEGHAQQVLDKL